jgi:hypothetical protein
LKSQKIVTFSLKKLFMTVFTDFHIYLYNSISALEKQNSLPNHLEFLFINKIFSSNYQKNIHFLNIYIE